MQIASVQSSGIGFDCSRWRILVLRRVGSSISVVKAPFLTGHIDWIQGRIEFQVSTWLRTLVANRILDSKQSKSLSRVPPSLAGTRDHHRKGTHEVDVDQSGRKLW